MHQDRIKPEIFSILKSSPTYNSDWGKTGFLKEWESIVLLELFCNRTKIREENLNVQKVFWLSEVPESQHYVMNWIPLVSRY